MSCEISSESVRPFAKRLPRASTNPWYCSRPLACAACCAPFSKATWFSGINSLGWKMAEGSNLKSNGLLRGRGRRRCNSRLGVEQLLSTLQLGLHDAVFGRQVFVPRQHLLVHRPRPVSQDARPIHKRPLPCPALPCPVLTSETATPAVGRTVPVRLWHCQIDPACLAGSRPFQVFGLTRLAGWLAPARPG